MDERQRISTAKSVLHLGTSTEFKRLGTSGLPKTPFKPGTGYRSGTGFKPATSFKGPHTAKPGTPGFRLGTAASVNRPMTAVRGAGYTSHGKPFDPLNQNSTVPTPPLELLVNDSPQGRLHQQERKIIQLVEECCLANQDGDNRKALSKAKEASNKEANLIKVYEQIGSDSQPNVDLTFVTLFNLANQFAINELYNDSLTSYNMLIKNRMFVNAHRLKMNMGNIYLKQGQHQMAIKYFRMALDQVPTSQKNLRVKIMHNIAMVFIKMGQWAEASSNLEYIMSESPCHRAGLHLVTCSRALEDSEQMKTSFTMLLNVPYNDFEEKYKDEQDNADDQYLAEAIKEDTLHKYEQIKRKEAAYCILTAAKMIAPHIEDTFSIGYDWCINAIKISEYGKLATDLEINKAVMFLKQKQLPEAIETLKAFEKDSEIAVNAAVNLSFIYYLQGDYQNAMRYGEVIKNNKHADGFVNLGACLMAQGHYDKAIKCFKEALQSNNDHFEATYNLGLVLKKQGYYGEALECFQKFEGSLALLPAVLYQIAHLLELQGDAEAAADVYQQLVGLVPSDAGALKKLGELYDHEGDKQQAHHYHMDSYRYYPANLRVTDWLGSYYIEMQVVEKALVYFEKAAIMQPNLPKWNMMVAACHRRSGNMHKALTLYQDIHRQFPENEDCLKFLVKLCNDLGMREAQDYILELKKLEKAKEVRERVTSSRPGSRRSNSGLSSRGGSGATMFSQENMQFRTPKTPMSEFRQITTANVHHSADSSDSGFAQQYVDATYSDPLGPQPSRPRTAAGKPVDFENFDNDELGDDLLPE